MSKKNRPKLSWQHRNFSVVFTTENEIIRSSWRQIYRLLIRPSTLSPNDTDEPDIRIIFLLTSFCLICRIVWFSIREFTDVGQNLKMALHNLINSWLSFVTFWHVGNKHYSNSVGFLHCKLWSTLLCFFKFVSRANNSKSCPPNNWPRK